MVKKISNNAKIEKLVDQLLKMKKLLENWC